MFASMLLFLKGEFATSAPTEQFLPISLPYWVTAHINVTWWQKHQFRVRYTFKFRRNVSELTGDSYSFKLLKNKKGTRVCSYLLAQVIVVRFSLSVCGDNRWAPICGFLCHGRRFAQSTAAHCCPQQDRRGMTGAKAQTRVTAFMSETTVLPASTCQLCHLWGRANISLAADRFLHSSKSAPRKNTIIKHSLQQGSSTELGQHLNSGKPL